jgi:ferredoxin
MKDQVRKWLEDGTVDIFIGYRMIEGHPIPFGFTPENLELLEELTTGRQRYPLEKLATHIAAAHPEAKIGLIARDCTQRSLNVLYIWNQLDPDKIQTLTQTCCPSPLGASPVCSYLEPAAAGCAKQASGIDGSQEPDAVETLDAHQRLDRWMYEFSKCIKCYGCRNICPVCFCTECSLENSDLIENGSLPPDVPIFHLVRAVHMAGRCIDCGLCEEACPVDIPLRLLYRKVNAIVGDLFDYTTGASAGKSPFSALGDEPILEPQPLEAAN